MSWPVAAGMGAGLAAATLVAAPGSLVAWLVVGATVTAAVRQYRTGSEYARGRREGYAIGYANGVADERQRAIRAARAVMARRGQS